MHHPVMPITEKDEIGKVGRPTADPVHDMVRRSPTCRPVTTWPRAAAVANLERFALRARYHPLGATHIDDHGLGVEQDAGDAAVASQTLDCFRGDRERELHLRRRRATHAEKGFERGRDLKVRPPARHAVVERMHREADDRIPQPPIALAILLLAPPLPQPPHPPPHTAPPALS